MRMSAGRSNYYGGKYCQGLCDDLENNPGVGGKKYTKHCFCSRCDRWMLKSILKPHETWSVVCPCCNFRPRMMSRYNKSRNGVKVEYARY